MTDAKNVKTILCLANSDMWEGRCVAGKEVLSGGRLGNWIRPVNTLKHKGIPDEKADSFSVLDLVQIPLLKCEPDLHQSENYLIDKSLPWELVGRASWRDITGAIDLVPGALWESGYHSQNDRIPGVEVRREKRSLLLVQPKDLVLYLLDRTQYNKEPQVRAKFTFNGEKYGLSVTAPEIRKQCPEIKKGECHVSVALLCVSLAGVCPHDGYAYKLVASVITEELAQRTIFTIGHSNHPWGKFVELLKMHAIDAVADVRSHPYSRYCPQFNREAVDKALRAEGIRYVYLGCELGGRPPPEPKTEPKSKERQFYDEKGKVIYEQIAGSDLFRQGLKRLLKGCKTYRIALMCAEQDPLVCHRMLLVARALDEEGIAVRHILADGKLETQEAALRRKTDDKNSDFFPAEKTRAAYFDQEKKVAYTRPTGKPQ